MKSREGSITIDPVQRPGFKKSIRAGSEFFENRITDPNLLRQFTVAVAMFVSHYAHRGSVSFFLGRHALVQSNYTFGGENLLEARFMRF